MNKISSVDTAKEIIDIIVNELFPEEMPHLQIFWEIFRGYLNEWKDIDPNKWPIREYHKRLGQHLAFSDISEFLRINGIKIGFIVSAVTFKVSQDVNYYLREKNKELLSIIEIYGNEVAASGPLIGYLKNKIPVLLNVKNKAAIEKEEKRYMKYYHDNKAGERITESGYQALMNTDKKTYLIWINERNEDFLIKGSKPEKAHPKERRALACLIINIGEKTLHKKLYEAIHNMGEINITEWDKRRIEYVNDIFSCIYSLRKCCPEIKRFVVTISGSGYKLDLPSDMKYCLIKELPEENT